MTDHTPYYPLKGDLRKKDGSDWPREEAQAFFYDKLLHFFAENGLEFGGAFGPLMRPPPSPPTCCGRGGDSP